MRRMAAKSCKLMPRRLHMSLTIQLTELLNQNLIYRTSPHLQVLKSGSYSIQSTRQAYIPNLCTLEWLVSLGSMIMYQC